VSALAAVAAVLGDRTRARILDELLCGVPLPAGALAARVGVAPSTVSGHLGKLEAAGLVAVEARGRRREVRLAGADVAEALEALARLAPPDPAPVGLRAVTRQAQLRHARSCYDHLAGQLGVALTAALVARGALARADGALSVPDDGAAVYAELGVDVAALRAGRRPLVRACPDWTERRAHVAGALGAALLSALLARGWLERCRGSRALRVTPAGRPALAALTGGTSDAEHVASAA
jgi:DNA-binding transcriptional ArsR family regulator